MTFADAAAEWLRFIEEDRERKPSTLRDYRSALNAHLLPAFGERPIEAITTEEIEVWGKSLTGLSNRSKNKLLARVEKHPMRRCVTDEREDDLIARGNRHHTGMRNQCTLIRARPFSRCAELHRRLVTRARARAWMPATLSAREGGRLHGSPLLRC
ncbi:MAG: hypothetical protein ABI323_05005 [Solirubrobacteraceae bacterium]